MKIIRWVKTAIRKEACPHAPSKEAGYILSWVIILMVVCGLVMGPFLSFMMTGTTAAHSYADTMEEFYAADSGVEDATYKIMWDYSALTQLSDDIDANDTDIPVVDDTGISTDGTALFPERGMIKIGSELIYYTSKEPAKFIIDPAAGGSRGYRGSSAANHNSGSAVSASLPDPIEVGDVWEYGITDVNGKRVDITLESVWLLEGLESDHGGTIPHQGLFVIGQMLNATGTALSSYVSDSTTTIPVTTTTGFPTASADDPSIIRIEDELISYTGKTATQFTGCTRGAGGTTPADHEQNTAVTSEEVSYRIDVTYDGSLGVRKVERIGCWLPNGFSYVPGSSNLTTKLKVGILTSATDIAVDSVDYFTVTDYPDGTYGVAAIDHELIKFTGTQGGGSPRLTGCERGYGGTIPADHSALAVVSAEPNIISFHGGNALRWDFPANLDFEALPSPTAEGLGSESEPQVEFPIKRTLTFSFSPAAAPKGIFSWIRVQSMDVFLSWDTSSGIYKVDSVATSPLTSTHTDLESYVGMCKLTGRTTQVFGDARAIGNSLEEDTNHDSDHIKDVLLSESSAAIDDIPEDATVKAAYLYWSAWKSNYPYGSTPVDQLSSNQLTTLYNMVNEATFSTPTGSETRVVAERVQAQRRILSGSTQGWVYSAMADVTSLLEPSQAATITFSPVTVTQSITITDGRTSSDFDIRIRLLSGPTGGYVTFMGQNISVGSYRDFGFYDSQQLTSSNVAGTYTVRVEATGSGDYGTVDGTRIDQDGSPGPTYTSKTLTTSSTVPPITITKVSGTHADVEITNDPASPGDITLDGNTISPGETRSETYISTTPHTINGASGCIVNITCGAGIVEVRWGLDGSQSICLGGPGSRVTNGEYTVGDLKGITDSDLDDSGSYAGWSLVVLYSSPSEDAHLLYLYDTFRRVNQYSSTLTSTITGFLAPEDFEGRLTAFVGEGDPGSPYTGDSIKVNGYLLPRPGDPWDVGGINPQNDVWNSRSSGIGGESIDGIDIDTFDVSSVIGEGDTAATLAFDTGQDGWALIFILVSFKTDPSTVGAESPVGIITFTVG